MKLLSSPDSVTRVAGGADARLFHLYLCAIILALITLPRSIEDKPVEAAYQLGKALNKLGREAEAVKVLADC
jgi:hypothetical protein